MTTNVQVYSYPLCSTCRKAIRWLDENNITFDLLDIVKTPPTKDLLLKAIDQLESRKKIFNTSGASYRNLGAKYFQALNDEEVLEALASDGKLIKRPFLITEKGKILIGFKPEVWGDILLA